jgi:hypothetical protein
VVGDAANVYFTDEQAPTVRAISRATQQVVTLAGSAGQTGSTDGVGPAARFDLPVGLALDGAGHLFIADEGTQTIRSLDLATNTVSTLAGNANTAGFSDGVGVAASFNGPVGLAFGGGQLWVSDNTNCTVRAIDVASARVSTFAGTAGLRGTLDGVGAAARFSVPSGMAFDGQGTLYLADGNTVRSIDVASARVSTLAGSTTGYLDGVGVTAQFNGVRGIAWLGNGTLVVGDATNNALRSISLTTQAVTTFAGHPGRLGVTLGALPAQLNQPNAPFAFPDGSLVFADEYAILLIAPR